MNIQETTLLVIQRYKALIEHKQASKQYIQDMTVENYELMQIKKDEYQRHQSIIYTHENMVEMLELLKESADKKILIDEIDGLVVTLVISKSGYPLMSVKAIKTDA